MSPKTTPSASRVSAALEERLPRGSSSGISWKGAPSYPRTAQNANLAPCAPRVLQTVIELQRKTCLFSGTCGRLGTRLGLVEQHGEERDRSDQRAYADQPEGPPRC